MGKMDVGESKIASWDGRYEPCCGIHVKAEGDGGIDDMTEFLIA